MSTRRTWGLVLFVFAGMAVLATCKSSSSPDEVTPVKDDPSFAADIQPVFNTCTAVSCHGGAAADRAGPPLRQAYNNLVNVTSGQEPPKKRVLPGDATNSYVVVKPKEARPWAPDASDSFASGQCPSEHQELGKQRREG
jgi:predicted CxxxxCH...CXXCH cytochrome family protein